jgi:hypothetical protein
MRLSWQDLPGANSPAYCKFLLITVAKRLVGTWQGIINKGERSVQFTSLSDQLLCFENTFLLFKITSYLNDQVSCQSLPLQSGFSGPAAYPIKVLQLYFMIVMTV